MTESKLIAALMMMLFVGNVLGIAMPVRASPTTYYVNVNIGSDARTPSDAQSPSTPWKTISYAVSKASSGDTIIVAPGIYNEAVGIDKLLTLIGQPGAVIQPDNTRGATPFYVRADGVTIQGFEIDGTHSSGRVWYGIYAYNTNDLTIQNNIIHDMGNDPTDQSGLGILVVGLNATVNNNMISGNTVYNTARMGIFVGGWETSPIIHLLSRNNTISYNEVYHTWQGPTNNSGAAIQIMGAKDSVIKNNKIHDTTAGTDYYGILLFGSSTGNMIQSNCVHDNSYGIVLWINPTDVRFSSSDVPAAPAVHYNAIYLNSKYDMMNIASPLVVDATGNWWGSNAGPDPARVGPPTSVEFNPWLVIGVSANPTAITAGGSGSTITADMTKNSLGVDTSGGGHITDGTIIQFSTNLGSLTLGSASTTNGKATTTLTSLAAGTATVTASTPPYTANATVNTQASVHAQLADWWPMFHHDLTHTGYSTSKAPNTNQTVWSYRTSSYVTSSPAVVDGMVFVGSGDNNVYGLNATTGTRVWNYTTDGPVNWASPAVAGGVVYVGSNDGNVYALNALTGAKVWSYTTDSAIFSSPAVVSGVVYEGSTDGNVYALNALTGAKVWSYTTDSEVWSSPAVAGGVVYVGSDDANVYALNATTGAKVWNYTTDDWVESSPAVDYGMVFVGSYDNNIYALNASTGAFIWSYTTDGYVVSSPAVAGGVVYVGSDDANVYALNATTGSRVWNYTTGNSVESSPAVASGVVYVGSMDRYVYALNATTGVLVWSYLTYGLVFSSPAVAGGVVYVGSTDRRIYAFGKQVGIYPQDPKEPAPMGIADYGISPAGPYEYATKSFVGIVTIKSLSTNSSFNDPLVPDTKMGFQLNVNLAFNTSYGQYVYWIQNTMGIDTSTNRVTFGNNVWNSSAFRANMSASGISGNGQVDLSAPRSFYYCGVNQSAILSLPGNNITLTYPITITLNVTSGIDSSGEPTVSFAYDDGYGLITYDTVTFTNVTGLTSLSGFEVNGFIYKPSGSFYNSELILGGPSDGYNTHALQSDVRLQLEYWNGHNYEVVPNAYNFGRDTAEGIGNVLSEFSYYQQNGRITAMIQAGAGKLGELYDESQTGVFNITSPLTSGTLCVANASDPNATTWQIPFVGGEVTVTLYPGYYFLQLYDQYGEFFYRGNFTVSAGQVLYVDAHILGDVNSDGRVDMKDVSYVARRFMCTPSDSLWDPVADINSDGKIDMKDISTVARHFGEHYP